MKKLLAFVVLILLFSCQSEINGVFYISNGSKDQPEVPLRLIMDNDTIFGQIAKYSNIAPDLQYVENIKLTKGKHKIIFEVADKEIKQIENVEFDTDKWIFLSYEYKKPADSLKRIELDKVFSGIKKADSIYSNFYNGRKPSLTFHILENEPIHH